MTDPCHWRIVEFTRQRGFRGDCQVIAEQVGVSVDRVNLALAPLLGLRLLEIRPGCRWKDLIGSEGRTKVPEETARFCSTLFGWTVNDNNPLGYWEIRTGAQEAIQGGIWPAPPQAHTFVQLFIAVDNVRTFSEQAEKEGAKVIIPPTSLPCQMVVK